MSSTTSCPSILAPPARPPQPDAPAVGRRMQMRT
jgi:hypothetical protein